MIKTDVVVSTWHTWFNHTSPLITHLAVNSISRSFWCSDSCLSSLCLRNQGRFKLPLKALKCSTWRESRFSIAAENSPERPFMGFTANGLSIKPLRRHWPRKDEQTLCEGQCFPSPWVTHHLNNVLQRRIHVHLHKLLQTIMSRCLSLAQIVEQKPDVYCSFQ